MRTRPATGPTAMAVSELAQMGAEYNPRTIKAGQLRALRRSLVRFGAVQPVVVNRRSKREGWPAKSRPVVVGGHQRIKAAAAEEIDTMPITWVDLDSAGERQLNLALNKIAGDWDVAKLQDVVRELGTDTADLGLTGFTDAELRKLVPDGDLAVQEDGGDATIYGGATAMSRTSAPIACWRKGKLLREPVLDFGSGREGHGFARYDAFHAPDTSLLLARYRTVMCNYVLNVQPALHLVTEILALVFHLVEAKGRVLIAVRNDVPESGRTSRGYQRRMERAEWEELLRPFFLVDCVEESKFLGWTCKRVAA